MSENENPQAWAQEFGCEVVSIPRLTSLVVQAALTGVMPLIAVGDTGQGKSDGIYTAFAILKKLARNGDFTMAPGSPPSNPLLKAAYKEARREREAQEKNSSHYPFTFDSWVPATADAFDYRGLPFICKETNRQKYSRPDMIPSDMVGGQGIINVREMNRPAAARTVKPLIEMMESRMLGPHIIPEGYRIIGDLNVGSIYDVHDILTPFFIRRVTWVYVQNSLEDWVQYMENKYAASLVVDFLIDNPDYFDAHDARVNNRIYACAASWEKVHVLLERAQGRWPAVEIRELISGMIGRDIGSRFIEFCSRGLELSPRKILEDYKTMRKQVLRLIEDGHGGDVVASAAMATIKALKGYDPDGADTETAIQNFGKFFCDLPLEVAQNTAIELAPPASTLNQPNSGVVEKVDETRQKMIQRIHHHLMLGNQKSRGRLAQLNSIISKRSGAPTDQ